MERNADLYRFGDWTQTKYQQETLNTNRLIEGKEQKIAQLQASLQRPKEVETAVRTATEIVAKQIRRIVNLERLQEYVDKLRLDPGESSKLGTKVLADVLKQTKEKLNTLDKDLEFFDDAPAAFDAKVREMIWKQKRALLQQFVDFDEKKRRVVSFNSELDESQKIYLIRVIVLCELSPASAPAATSRRWVSC